MLGGVLAGCGDGMPGPPVHAAWRGRAGDAGGAASAFEELLSHRMWLLGPDYPKTVGTVATWLTGVAGPNKAYTIGGHVGLVGRPK